MCKARPRKIEAFLENKWAGVQVEITEDVIFDWKAVLIIIIFLFIYLFFAVSSKTFFFFFNASLPPSSPVYRNIVADKKTDGLTLWS